MGELFDQPFNTTDRSDVAVDGPHWQSTEFGSQRSAFKSNLDDKKSPLIVVDDFMPAPESFVTSASSCVHFAPPSTGYPGLNARMEWATRTAMIDAVKPLLSEFFGFPGRSRLEVFDYYGLITKSGSDLTPLQAIPHYDFASDDVVVALLYLCDSRHGGTGFFYHKATGLSSITSATQTMYEACRDAELLADQDKPRHIVTAPTDRYGVLTSVDARFNRLVMYRASRLHSALATGEHKAVDPIRGRLTANLFIRQGGDVVVRRREASSN